MKLQKALYGLLKNDLIFYKTLLKDLLSMGFQPNPYDPCVVNKKIDGSQMTITLHVDDFEVSHKDPRRINEVAGKLKQVYGNIKMKSGKYMITLGCAWIIQKRVNSKYQYKST